MYLPTQELHNLIPSEPLLPFGHLDAQVAFPFVSPPIRIRASKMSFTIRSTMYWNSLLYLRFQTHWTLISSEFQIEWTGFFWVRTLHRRLFLCHLWSSIQSKEELCQQKNIFWNFLEHKTIQCAKLHFALITIIIFITLSDVVTAICYY